MSVSVPLARQIVDWDEFVGRFEAIRDGRGAAPGLRLCPAVAFSDGDIVKKGQLLFVIDPRPYEAALAQARADIKSAEAQAANAKVELERAKTLLDKGFVSKSAYDARDRTGRCDASRGGGGQGPGAATRPRLEFTRVTSPIPAGSPTIASTSATWSASRPSPPHAADHRGVAGPDPLRLHRLGGGLPEVPAGQRGGHAQSSRYASNPVDIQLQDETGYAWHGRMDFVDNAIDTGSGTIRGRAVVANPNSFLTPGMYGRMRLWARAPTTALLVPDAAVAADQSDKVVLVAGTDDTVAPHKVTLGPARRRPAGGAHRPGARPTG